MAQASTESRTNRPSVGANGWRFAINAVVMTALRVALCRLTWEVLNHFAYEIAKVGLHLANAEIILVRLRR